MHFQVLILTSSMSGKSKKSYWQAFSYAGDSIHKAFFHLGSVPLESTVADALDDIFVNCPDFLALVCDV